MKLRIIISVFAVIFGLVFLAGMAVGYYIALSLMNKIALLAIGAFGFAFLTWVGSGADLLGLLRDWYKEKKDEEKIPVLEYKGVIRTPDENREIGGKKRVESTYFLRVKMVKGEGMTEHCVAFLAVVGSTISRFPCVWADSARVCDIPKDVYMDLRLFTLVKERTSDGELAVPTSLIFFAASPYGLAESGIPYAIYEKPFADFYEKQLSVTLGAKKGRVPALFVETIRNIIDAARTEGGKD